MNEEPLVTACTIGLAPIVRTAVPVAVEQAPATGLQTPMVTVPPVPLVANGRLVSVIAGTVMVRTMFEEFITLTAKLVSVASDVPETTPTFVAREEFVLGMNPEPVSVTVKVWPAAAVGRLAGETLIRLAPGDCTLTLKVTRIVADGVPHVMVAVPVSNSAGRSRREDERVEGNGYRSAEIIG